MKQPHGRMSAEWALTTLIDKFYKVKNANIFAASGR